MPTQKDVELARKDAHLTRKQAAEMMGVKPLTWARYEGKTSRKTVMPDALWERFKVMAKAVRDAK